jgi:hypothetical protein
MKAPTGLAFALRCLADAKVKSVVVGGFAGTVLGSPRVTVDRALGSGLAL